MTISSQVSVLFSGIYCLMYKDKGCHLIFLQILIMKASSMSLTFLKYIVCVCSLDWKSGQENNSFALISCFAVWHYLHVVSDSLSRLSKSLYAHTWPHGC